MPRVKASMAEVSTDFSPPEPGVHQYEIEEVKENTNDDNRTHYAIKCKIIAIVDGGREEDVGRSVTERVHIHLKTGELNEFGLAQLKRFFEVTVGDERANDPDADTDWLIGQRFLGQTDIERYSVQDSLTGQSEERSRAKISRLAPLN